MFLEREWQKESDYEECTEYAEYAKHAEYIPIVFLVEKSKISESESSIN